MKYLHLFLLFFCLVEIYGQRGRAPTSTENANNVDRPRGRGRSRFVATDELAQLQQNSDSSLENRRTSSSRRRPSESRSASTETRVQERPRINSRPTAAPAVSRNSYAVEEIVNDSPVDSFVRRSKPRVLTDTRFDNVPLPRSRASLDLPAPIQQAQPISNSQIDELANEFGSTARGILLARGYQLSEQTTQKPDEEIFSSIGEIARSLAPTRVPSEEEPEEEYVFGSAARTLIASRGGVLPVESTGARLSPSRATPLRSETPILSQEDLRRTEIGAEPLPSFRGSDPELTRRAPVRGESRRTPTRQEAERAERPQSRGRSRSRDESLSVRGPDPELTRQTLARGGPEIIERTPSRSQNRNINTVETEVESLLPANVKNLETQKEIIDLEEPLALDPQTSSLDMPQISDNAERTLSNENVEDMVPDTQLFKEAIPDKPSVRSDLPKPLFREDIDNARNFIPMTMVRTTEIPEPRRVLGRTRSRVEKTTTEEPEFIQPVFRTNSVENYVKFEARATEEPIAVPEEPIQRRGFQIESYQPRRVSQVEEVVTRRSQPQEVAPRKAPVQESNTPRRIQVPAVTQASRRIQISSRSRIRTNSDAEEPVTSSSRTRAPRTRATRRPEEPNTIASRPRASPRRQYEQVAAESRSRLETRTRGPSVFLANDGEITSRSRSGRRIESAPQRFTIELSATTSRSRGSVRVAANSGFPEKEPGLRINYNEPALKSRTRTYDRYNSNEKPLKTSEKYKNNIELENSFSEKDSGLRINSNEPALKSRTRTYDRKNFNEKPLKTREEFKNIELESFGKSKKRLGFEERQANLRQNAAKQEGTRKGMESQLSVEEKSRKAFKFEPEQKAKSRYLELPLDETKLEVLPLFETEPKVVMPPNRLNSKSNRREKLADFLEAAPESNIRFVEKAMTNAAIRASAIKTESLEAKTVPTTKKRTTRASSSSTTTSSTTTRAPVTRPPIIKESVVAEYNEVTSKSTITRKKKGGKTNRGNKKADIKLEGGKKKSSDEDLDEEDNYPEAFKALIQAKKKKEDKPKYKDTATLKYVVTSSPTTKPTSAASARRTSNRPQVTENAKNNEIEPKPTKTTDSTKPTTRRKFQPSKTTETKPNPTVTTQNRKNNSKSAPEFKHRRKVLRSTAVPPSTTPTPAIINGKPTPHRFSAKFVKKEQRSLEEKVGSTTVKGLYSSKNKNEKNRTFNKTERFIEKSTPANESLKKFNRYSSRYRSELSAKIAHSKSSTSAPFYVPTIPTPVYVPTVPTVIPPQPTVLPTRHARNHEEYESITILDEQQNDIPSDNLVRDGTTEKTVSIIERIINSITAISTTASPKIVDTNSSTTTTTDASENSAILKLATKKSTDRQTHESVTSEKPTTKIIEKILVSLNAIQSNEVDSARMPKELENFVSQTAKNRAGSSSTTENITVSTTSQANPPSSTEISTVNSPSSTETSTVTSASKTTNVPSTVATSVVTDRTSTHTVPTTVGTSEISTVTTIPIESSTTTRSESTSTTMFSTTTQVTSSSDIPTIPSSLNELLNDKTVKALNNIIKTDDVTSTKAPPEQVNKYNEVLNIQDLLNKNYQNQRKPVLTPQEIEVRTIGPPSATTANIRKAPYAPETSTTESSNTVQPSTLPLTTIPTTTASSVRIISQPPTSSPSSGSRRPSSSMPEVVVKSTTPISTLIPSTILPTLISTLFPSLVGGSTVRSGRSGKFSTDTPSDGSFELFTVSGTTAHPTSVAPPLSTSQKISTTTTPTTSTTATSSTTPTTTTEEKPTSTTQKIATTTKKLKQLTEEQKKNLEEIAKLEKQQSELLRQLNFLTSVFGGPNVKLPNSTAAATKGGGAAAGLPSDLASRILAMAQDRNKSTTKPPKKEPATTTTKKPTTKRPNSIQDQLPTTTLDISTRTTPSLEEILKQYNLTGVTTPEPLTSTYGKSDEALLATLLKQQGIEPTTPKALADNLKEASSTTKKPKPRPRPRTTPRPGRLMQGLNWLLDLLDPPTTRRPATRKPTTKRKTTTKATTTNKPETTQAPADAELLTHQPSRITPVVTLAPMEKVTKPSLSQDEIQSLIKQLEAAQADPKAANEIDFSKIKSLQTLLDADEGVQVISPGNNGATLRGTQRAPKAAKSTARPSPVYKSTTPVPSSVSNRLEDFEEDSYANNVASTSVLPPVSLNPIRGVDDRGQGDNFIRSNLLNAAVGVTRAISNFFGSAIQGARESFRSIIAGAASGTSSLSG